MLKNYFVTSPWVYDKLYQPGDVIMLDEEFAAAMNAQFPGMLEEKETPEPDPKPLESGHE